MEDFSVSITALSLLVAYILYSQVKARSRAPYPPGPTRLPLIGNLLQIPSSDEWLTYRKWCRELGTDILYMYAAGKETIVLDSMEAIEDLFDKRSSIYSSRPKLPMAQDLMGWTWAFGFMEYGEPWRERRRLFTQNFHPANIAAQHPHVMKFVRQMLPRLRDSPDEFLEISKHAVDAHALSMAYGVPVQEVNDPYIHVAEKAVHSLNESLVLGKFLVNIVPAIQHFPEYLPGMSFKKLARQWKKFQEDFREKPFARTVQDMSKGIAQRSFVANALGSIEELSQDEKANQREMIKENAAHIFQAATEATRAATHTLFVAMLSFPEVQKKAQAELDRVLDGRLPDFRDEADTPYITAIVKEVLRWRPPAPFGMPHATTEDDVYRGYFIPKGAIVIANAWSLLQDENHFPDHEVFRPERFLTKEGKLRTDVRDPTNIIFGYGRRVCPGSHVALSFLWLTAASILSTFNITKALDEKGRPIEPQIDYESTIIYEPLPFPCTIKPRSKHAVDLISDLNEYDI